MIEQQMSTNTFTVQARTGTRSHMDWHDRFIEWAMRRKKREGYLDHLEWSTDQVEALARLESYEVRLNTLCRMKKKEKANIRMGYCYLFMCFLIFMILFPGGLFTFVFCMPVSAFLLHSEGFGARLVAINAIIETIRLTRQLEQTREQGMIGKPYALYLRNFTAESRNESRISDAIRSSLEDVSYECKDSVSSYIHRSVIRHCSDSDLTYLEAANFFNPPIGTDERARSHIFSISLYEAPDWREHVSAWLRGCDLVILNINSDTLSLRFEIDQVLQVAVKGRMLVEKYQWDTWVKQLSFELKEQIFVAIYEESTVHFPSSRIPERLEHISMWVLLRDGQQKKMDKVELAQWLAAPEQLLN